MNCSKCNSKMAVTFLLLIIFFLFGCASSQRYISKPSEPAHEIGISSKTKEISVNLNSLIVPNGPGSWVKNARWDEYVFTIKNLSNYPVIVMNIRLVDPRGINIESNLNPEQLEEKSKALIKEYKIIGISVAIGAAPAIVAGTAASAGAVGTYLGASMLIPVAFFAAPVVYSMGKYTDMKDKERIEGEFNKRRLTMFTLSDNEAIKGSAFFPIVPNPKTLVFEYQTQNKVKALGMSLEKIAGLHIGPPKKPEKEELK